MTPQGIREAMKDLMWGFASFFASHPGSEIAREVEAVVDKMLSLSPVQGSPADEQAAYSKGYESGYAHGINASPPAAPGVDVEAIAQAFPVPHEELAPTIPEAIAVLARRLDEAERESEKLRDILRNQEEQAAERAALSIQEPMTTAELRRALDVFSHYASTWKVIKAELNGGQLSDHSAQALRAEVRRLRSLPPSGSPGQGVSLDAFREIGQKFKEANKENEGWTFYLGSIDDVDADCTYCGKLREDHRKDGRCPIKGCTLSGPGQGAA